MHARSTFWLAALLGAVILPTAILPAAAMSAEPPAEKLRAVLWIGGFAHDFEAIAKNLAEALPKRIPIEIEIVRDGSFLDRPKAKRPNLILMNHCHKSTEGVLSESQKAKLLELVRGGVGVVAMHASYYSFLEWDAVRELYGAKFTKHGAVDIYLLVSMADKDHPITADLGDSFETHSELYQSTPLSKDCRVLAVAKEKGTDKQYPSVWTKTYGKGRVVTILPAHWPDAYKVAEFQKLIAASALWAAKPDKENP